MLTSAFGACLTPLPPEGHLVCNDPLAYRNTNTHRFSTIILKLNNVINYVVTLHKNFKNFGRKKAPGIGRG